MKKLRFRDKAEQKLNKQRKLERLQQLADTTMHLPRPLPRFPHVRLESLAKVDTSVVDSILTENLEREIKTLIKQLSDRGEFKIYTPEGKLTYYGPIHFACTDEADAELWALIKKLPAELVEKYQKIVWPFSQVTSAMAAEVHEKAKVKELQAVFIKLDDRRQFNLRSVPYAMQRPGGYLGADPENYIGTKRIGVDQAEEDKLWAYLNSLPDWIHGGVVPYFGRINDAHQLVPTEDTNNPEGE